MSAADNVVELHGLKVVLLPGAGVPAEARTYYESAYGVWKTVWKKTLFELDGSDRLYSDHFTRQDFHLTVFHGSRCVTAISFRRVDLQSSADLEDSWLKIWPQEILSSYKETLKKGMMTSWFYVDPEYRRADADNRLARLQVSQRVTEMISFLLIDLNADIIFGGVRNNRSVNKLIEPTGCKVVMPDVENHGVKVDLVTWLPVNVKPAVEHFSKLTHNLWADRLVFESQPVNFSKPSLKKRAS